MTAITDSDRFDAHWQSLNDLIDNTTDTELLDSMEADLQRLANHARERCRRPEADAPPTGIVGQPAPITPKAHSE